MPDPPSEVVARAAISLRVRRRLVVAAFFVFFLVLLASRLEVFFLPEFHESRQLHVAQNARTIYCDWLNGQNCAANLKTFLLLEPPVLESLTALAYRVAGGEALWIARTISALAWLIAAFFLFSLIREQLSTFSAAIGTGFFVFHPFLVEASTSIQPDPLMICFVLLTYRSFQRTGDWASPRVLIPLAFSVFIKAYAVFFFLPLIVATWRGIHRRQVAAFALAMTPVALYYGIGIWDGFLFAQAKGSVMPFLLFQAYFYESWLGVVWASFGFSALLVIPAVVLNVGSKRRFRRWSRALFAGYCLMGVVFTYHVHTHDYYSLFLAIPIALGAAGLAEFLRLQLNAAFRYIGVGLLLIWLGVHILSSLPSVDDLAERRVRDRQLLARYAELADFIRPLDDVVVLCPAYGRALAYYGQLPMTHFSLWPYWIDMKYVSVYLGREIPSVEERFRQNRWRYFVVCLENLSELLEQKPSLNDYLLNYTYIRETPMDVVVDLERPIQNGS